VRVRGVCVPPWIDKGSIKALSFLALAPRLGSLPRGTDGRNGSSHTLYLNREWVPANPEPSPASAACRCARW
jgi:hypothetical protein